MKAPLLYRILISPRKEFLLLKDIPLSVRDTFFSIHLPVVVIATIILAFHFGLRDGSLSILAINYLGYTFTKWVLSILVSTWAINRLVSAFEGKSNIQNIYTLVSVSVTLLILSLSFSFFTTSYKALVGVWGIFGVYYFYLGSLVFTKILKERIVGFLLISLLIFTIITVFFELFFGIIFRIPIQL